MAQFEINGIHLDIPDAHLTDGLRREFERGIYEWGEVRALTSVLRAEDRLLDLGSAIGFVACNAAKILEPHNIICVEANPDLIPVLEANLAANGVRRARSVQGAVVPDAFDGEEVSFEVRQAFYSSRVAGEDVKEASRIVTVPALKLSDLLEAFAPDVVTMDLEGAEAALAMQHWPGKVRAVIMEIHTGVYSLSMVSAIFAGMSKNGFAFQPNGSRGDVVVFQRVGTE